MKKFVIPKTLPRADTPKGKKERQSLLFSIMGVLKDAEFPRDYHEYEHLVEALRDETGEGQALQKRWRTQAMQKGNNPFKATQTTICPAPLFLPLLQVQLMAAKLKLLETLTAGIPSVKRRAAASEVVPCERERLMIEAQADEDIVLAKLHQEFTGTSSFAKFVKSMADHGGFKVLVSPKQRQKQANQKQDDTPDIPCVCPWSQPMSQREYSFAAARSRKAIQRFLEKINAVPSVAPRHAADAQRYDVEVNLKVLAHWIGTWTPDDRQAAGLAGATIAYSDVYDSAFVGRIIRALGPVLERRGLIDAVAEEIKRHYNFYYPIPNASDLSAKVMGVIDQTRRDIDEADTFFLRHIDQFKS